MLLEMLVSVWLLVLPAYVALWSLVTLGPARDFIVMGLCYAGGGVLGALLSRAYRHWRKG